MKMIFYPPKPTLISITQPLFSQLDKDARFVAELKYNGDRLILQRFEDGSFEFWNRHGEKLRRYDPSPIILQHLKNLKWEGYCVCDGELLHHKTKHIKHHAILFDVFIWNGQSLKLKPFVERRTYLERLFGVHDNDSWVTIAPQWKTNFKKVFDDFTKNEEIEGLVMKRLDAKLQLGTSSSPTVKYMFKVRKPGPTYRF
jgi:ATP-dependent DNA ligase